MSHESNGQDTAELDEITWVGEQRLMHGYCGRAKAATGAAALPDAKPVNESRGAASREGTGRSQPARAKVVRIGPLPAVGANRMAPVAAKTLQRAA